MEANACKRVTDAKRPEAGVQETTEVGGDRLSSWKEGIVREGMGRIYLYLMNSFVDGAGQWSESNQARPRPRPRP